MEGHAIGMSKPKPEETDDASDASETDEEQHPSRPNAKWFAEMKAVDEVRVPEALAHQGVAMLAKPVLKRQEARRAAHACESLRDEASISCVFANPDSPNASPGACEAIHIDESVLAVLRAIDHRLAGAISAAISASEKAARAALRARGHTDVVQAGLPRASLGQGELTERWHCGSEGCPGIADTEPLLLTAVLTLDKLGSESLRVVMPPTEAASSSGKKRARSGAAPAVQMVPCTLSPSSGQLTLITPEAHRAAVHAPGAVSLTTWYKAAPRPPAAASCGSTFTSAGGAGAKGASKRAQGVGAKLGAGSAAELARAPAVFDGVLDECTRARLAATRPIRWALYDRKVARPRNAQERAIESMLDALGDNSRYVEYWGRPRWGSIPAHFDCDEGGLIERGVLRHPTSAHVLYLDVPPEVRGPTVLWRPRMEGEGSKDGGGAAGGHGAEEAGARIFTVPAVGGRLLRFCGSWVHGVPRPAREYIGEGDEEMDEEMDEENVEGAEGKKEGEEEGEEEGKDEGEDEGEEGEEKGEEEQEEEEEEGEEEEEEEEEEECEVRRLVLLFNTWAEPPTPDGKTDGEEGDGRSIANLGEPQSYDDDVPASCTPVLNWRLAPFVTDVKGCGAAGGSTAIVARLMGGPKRRGSAMRYRVDDAVAARTAVRTALTHATDPHCFVVR